MKRFLRILPPAATALSLLLCALLIFLWVRSVGHVGSTYWIRPELSVEVEQTDGVLGLIVARDSGLHPPVSDTDRLYGWFHWRNDMPRGRDRAKLTVPSFNRWGFGSFIAKTRGRPIGNWSIGGRTLVILHTPYWLPILLTAVPPSAGAARRLRRRRRSGAGRCRACGYDLRATPDRCPECGMIPAT